MTHSHPNYTINLLTGLLHSCPDAVRNYLLKGISHHSTEIFFHHVATDQQALTPVYFWPDFIPLFPHAPAKEQILTFSSINVYNANVLIKSLFPSLTAHQVFPCLAFFLGSIGCLWFCLLKLKLQYSGHLMWRTDSLEKTLMLGNTEGRRRGQQRMRWLDGITNSMDMFEQALGVGNGQGGLACCSPCGCKESDTTEWLNRTELDFLFNIFNIFI